MEKGKLYVFYKNKNYDVAIGEYIEEYGSHSVFKDNKGNMFLAEDVYDEVTPDENVFNFIEYLAAKFQNKFERNVSVWHEDYEFKIQFAHNDYRVLDDIEDVMNESLEDWWSVLWNELEYNNIQVKRNDVLISFRVRDENEIQFKYNDGGFNDEK